MSKFLLDPWSTIASLGLLPFMSAGIKIAVCDNRIEFYTSCTWDRVWRTLMDKLQSGYSRTAVLYLADPLNIATRAYASRDRLVVFEQACEGLRVLRRSYSTATDDQSRMVVQLLDGYIKSLNQCIRNTSFAIPSSITSAVPSIPSEHDESILSSTPPMLPPTPPPPPPSDNDDTQSNHSSQSDAPLAQSTMSMRDIWTREEIDIITKLFGLIKTKKSIPEQQPIVDSIRKLIDSKHLFVSELAKVRTAHIID